jgi:hypothetical protein
MEDTDIVRLRREIARYEELLLTQTDARLREILSELIGELRTRLEQREPKRLD